MAKVDFRQIYNLGAQNGGSLAKADIQRRDPKAEMAVPYLLGGPLGSRHWLGFLLGCWDGMAIISGFFEISTHTLSPSTRDRWRLRCSYLECLGEEEQRNHDLALNGIFLETIDTVASTATTAVYAVLLDSFH